MVELEDAFINLAFEQGGIEDTTPEDIEGYIRYIADRRLHAINLEPIFGIEKNPLVWRDYMLSGVEHASFFENGQPNMQRARLLEAGTMFGHRAKSRARASLKTSLAMQPTPRAL